MLMVWLTLIRWTTFCLLIPLSEPRPSHDPHLDRGYVGITITGDSPVVVSDVVPEGPAEKAGVQPEDVIVKISGLETRTRDEVIGMVCASRPGEVVIIEVLRGNETRKLEIRCIVRDEEEYGRPPGAPSPYRQ